MKAASQHPRILSYPNSRSNNFPSGEYSVICSDVFNTHQWKKCQFNQNYECECGMRYAKYSFDIITMYHYNNDGEDDEWPECSLSEADWAVKDVIE